MTQKKSHKGDKQEAVGRNRMQKNQETTRATSNAPVGSMQRTNNTRIATTIGLSVTKEEERTKLGTSGVPWHASQPLSSGPDFLLLWHAADHWCSLLAFGVVCDGVMDVVCATRSIGGTIVAVGVSVLKSIPEVGSSREGYRLTAVHAQRSCQFL